MLFIKKNIQEIFDSFDKRQNTVKKTIKILVNDDTYRAFLTTYKVDEILSDIRLYNYEEALNRNDYIANNDKELSIILWIIGSSGQGDSWFINKQTLSIMFYNHDKGEYENLSDFEDLGITFVQFLQMGFIVKELEEYMFDDKQEITQEIKLDFQNSLNSIKPDLFELYPYKYW